MGSVITDRGMQADPDKIAAISAMAQPRKKAGVQRFVGMAKCLSPYCPNLSTIIRPLTHLTKSDTPFMWAQAQTNKLHQCSNTMTSANQSLQVDASEEGVGGVLLQPNSEKRLQPVAYTSNSFNATEQRTPKSKKSAWPFVTHLEHLTTSSMANQKFTPTTSHLRSFAKSLYTKPQHGYRKC